MKNSEQNEVSARELLLISVTYGVSKKRLKNQFQPVFLIFSQTTNFRLFETEKVCRRQF